MQHWHHRHRLITSWHHMTGVSAYRDNVTLGTGPVSPLTEAVCPLSRPAPAPARQTQPAARDTDTAGRAIIAVTSLTQTQHTNTADTKFDAANFSERSLFFAGLPMYFRFVSHREYFPMSYETSCTEPDRRAGPGRQRAWWPGPVSLKLPGWHRLDTGHMERRDCHQPTPTHQYFLFPH